MTFVDHEVRVHQFERPFLSPGHPDHQTLGLFRHPAGFPALELVGPVVASPGNEHRTELNLSSIEKGMLHGTIHVPNLDQTVALFVDAFGFIVAKKNEERSARLSLHRPMPQWSMNLTLEEEVLPATVPTLDGRGWFVLALLSSDLRADALNASRHALTAITDPFVISVDKKEWAIVLCVLRSGFAIELMQPPKAAPAVGQVERQLEERTGV